MEGRAGRRSDAPVKSLDFDLGGRVGHYLRGTFVIAYLSSDANMLAAVRFLWIAELRAVTSPDQHRENLVWVRLIEVDEGRVSATSRSVMRTSQVSAHGGCLSDVFFGFRCRKGLLSLSNVSCKHDSNEN